MSTKLSFRLFGADSYIELIEKIERVDKLNHEVNCEAEAFSTNKADYKKAKNGIKKGEESYEESELSL